MEPSSDFQKGVECLRALNYKDAIIFLKNAAEAMPTPEVYLRLAQAYEMGNNLESAAEVYFRATKQWPESAQVHCNLGHYCVRIGLVMTAITAFEKALSLDELCVMGHIGQGLCYAVSGYARDAHASYKKAVEINPECPIACWNLGCSLFCLGDVETARSIWMRLLLRIADQHPMFWWSYRSLERTSPHRFN